MNCNPNLPIEIISLILYYLPLKSLLRFRQVNKSWKEIVGFVANQSNKSCFIFSRKDHNRLFIVHEKEEEDDGSSLISSPKISWKVGPKKLHRYPYYVKSFSNGMFCFSSLVSDRLQHYRTYIFNIGTQQLHSLPKLNPSKPLLRHIATSGGLDLSTSQFKVLMICITDDDPGFRAYIHILGSNSNSWRKLDSVPRDLCCRGSQVVINGMIYWMSRSRRIMYFDLATEMFGYFDFPESDFSFYEWKKIRLADLGGCLSMCDFRHHNHAEIWIRREASWIKLVDVVKTYFPAAELQGVMFQDVLPVTILKNGDLLLLYNSLVLVSYNFENKSYSPLQISGLPGYKLSGLDHNSFPPGQYQVNLYGGNVS